MGNAKGGKKMRKRNRDKDLHTKEWTANRIWGLMGLLLLEIFCVVWLILTEKQLIASILFVACAVGSMVGIVKLAKNYKRKSFKTLIEKDIEEDQKYAEIFGDGYYMWKAYTLPNIVVKGTKNAKMQLDDKDKVILERGKRIAHLEKALKLACLSLRGKCDYCKYKDDEICPPDHHCSNLVMEYFLE